MIGSRKYLEYCLGRRRDGKYGIGVKRYGVWNRKVLGRKDRRIKRRDWERGLRNVYSCLKTGFFRFGKYGGFK